MRAEYDFGIIGAGILGTTLAFKIAQVAQGKRIALFDRDHIGSGCSGYAGGIISPINLTWEHGLQSAMSRDWYHNVTAERPELLRRLSTSFICHDNSIEALKQKDSGIHAIDNNFARPDWLVTPEKHAFIGGSEALWGNVAAICQFLVQHNDAIALYECSPIKSYEKGANEWLLSLGDGSQIGVDRLALAKGAWLNPEEQSDQLILNKKKIVAYEISAPVDESSPLIYFYDHGAFLLPLIERQRWVLSITSQHWGCLPERELLDITQGDRLIAERILMMFAPSLVSSMRGGRSHCDGYVRERRPVAVTNPSGLVTLGGGSGSGFRFAPLVAEEAMNFLLNQ
ncbi:FAD-dependent oxidoreductase [Shewanella sp.]|uniref:FAD-dependent oxidoreductase n=1 Tax=Shewanella sp. TaxID=50422 RepID=UPI004053C0BD